MLREASNAGPKATAALTIHDRFRASARRHAHRVALVCGAERLSYAELDRRSSELAGRLIAQHVGAESLVGLCADRSIDTIVGILGILKAGAAYVPVDPTYPAAYRSKVLERVDALLWNRRWELPSELPAAKDALWIDDATRTPDGAQRRARCWPDSPAYVIHTSGSTGTPKGVVVTHSNVLRLLDTAKTDYGFCPNDTWSLFHSVSFDFSVWEIWGALLHGGRLAIPSQATYRAPEQLVELLRAEAVTVLNATPSLFRELLAVESLQRDGAAALPALRLVVFGGEALDVSGVAAWFRRVGSVGPRLVNMYGITETTVHVTHKQLDPSDVADAKRNPIGVPLADLRVDVVDDSMRLVNAGQIGEIIVAGAGLARGYLGRPDLTADRFRPDPFAVVPGSRVYRSGDLARREPSGELGFVGRADQQLKIRGFRVELNEIRSVLLAHPAVREAVVVARRPPSPVRDGKSELNASAEIARVFLKGDAVEASEPSLVAYVVMDRRNQAELGAYLATQLPAHMRPRSVVVVDGLARLPNGKIDFSALPPVGRSRPALSVSYRAPNSAFENTLARIWALVLDLDCVGVDDDFFLLGGDSIKMLRVHALAQGAGLDLNLPSLFEFSTIAALQAAPTEPGTQSAHAAKPFELVSEDERAQLPVGIEDAYPLTRLQGGLIYHSQQEPESPLYRDVIRYSLEGKWDLTALRDALEHVHRRHPILRTTIELRRFREPMQLVWSEPRVCLDVEDLRGLSAQERASRVDAGVRHELLRHQDLQELPPVRFAAQIIDERTFTLCVSFHDAFLDGWSTASLVTEWIELYDRLLRGDPLGAPEPPAVRFADYVAQERTVVGRESTRRFWSERLENWPAKRLADTLGERRQSLTSTLMVAVALGAELSVRLEDLAAQVGVGMKHVLLAAHLRVLSWLHGTTRVVTGVESSSRIERSGGDEALGVHLNTLPLCLDLADCSWLELCQRVRAVERDMSPHRAFPYSEIERLGAGGPLFDVSFNYTHFHVFGALERLQAVRVLGGEAVESTHFLLKAEFNRSPFTNQLEIDLECDAGGIDRELMTRLGEYYRRALEQMVDRPETICLDASLGSKEEHALLIEWSERSRAASCGRLEDLFAEQARVHPERVALVDAGRCTSYAELWAWAQNIAAALRGRGVSENDVVCIALPRCSAAIASMIGVLRAGAAYWTPELDDPLPHLAALLEDARPHLVLADSERLELLSGIWNGATLDVDAVERQSGGSTPPLRSDGRAAAYVIYTSGSTGAQKAVVGSHAAILNRLAWMWETHPYGDDSRVCHKTSLRFGDAVTEIFGPLCKGIPLVILPNHVVKDRDEFLKQLGSEAITHLTLVPSHLRSLLESEAPAAAALGQLACVVSSGEALPGELARKFTTLCPRTKLLNLYGATEVAADVSSELVALDDPSSFGSVGRPIAGVSVYVVDPAGNLRPPGMTGEVYVGGNAVTLGYRGRPDSTAERFVPDWLSGAASARLYRTGDLARWSHDGRLLLQGRADHEVKVRGHRVNLTEVEGALLCVDGIRDATVVAEPDPNTTTRLTAFVVGAESLTESELRKQLAASVPAYLVPATLVFVESLPRSASGKVDRPALSRLQRRPAALPFEAFEPSVTEALLLELWQRVLGGTAVALHDDFFSSGGDSISAVQLVARINHAFRSNLTLREFMQLQTVANLARVIDQKRGRADAVAMPSVRPAPELRHEPFPLTAIQEAYWVGRRKSEYGQIGSHLYVEFEREFDVGRLEDALNALIVRHDMLRMTVLPDGVQVVRPPSSSERYTLPVSDLSGLPGHERERRLGEIREQRAHHVFEPESWPLFALAASHLGDGRYRLHVNIDMLIADAWSVQLLVKELFAGYEGKELGPAPRVSYRDYVVAVKELSGGEQWERAKRYWQGRVETLANAPELGLRRLQKRVGKPQFERLNFRLGAEAWGRLKERATREGLSASVVLMTAFGEALGLYSRRRKFTLNLTLFDRLPICEGINEVVGDFTTLTLLELDVSGERQFVERARGVQEQLWQDLDHRYYSGVEVLRELGRSRGRGLDAQMPVVFTSTLNLRNLRVGRERHDWRLEPVYTVTQTPQVWLDHQVMEEGDELVVNWDVMQGVFEEGLIEELFADYMRAVERLSENAEAWEQPIGQWLSERWETRWSEVHDQRGPLPDERLEQPIERQARQQGERVAVVDEQGEQSYAELWERARQVAAELRVQGVQAGQTVGVSLAKGRHQVSAVLGVLRAAGAYVPIDPEWPEERRRYVMEQSGAQVVLTQQRYASAWPASLAKCVLIDGTWEATEATEFTGDAPTAEELAYVIYTSGSTGQPKGVMVQHAGAMNTIVDVNERWQIGARDAVLGLSSLSFDLSVYDVFGMLAAGGRVVVPSESGLRDPAHWAELIERHEVSVWNTVPALMRMLVEYKEGGGRGELGSLRLVLLSGDWLGVDLAERIRRVVGRPLQVVSLGGATEGSIWSIAHELGEKEPSIPSVPYGRSLKNQRIYVLDEEQNERAVWAPGELYIAGRGVAEGYQADAVRTQERFVTKRKSGERLYRTGDMGQYLPNGEIEFLGREDGQVKVNGCRIELSEVEAALERSAGVVRAVAIAEGERTSPERRLVAYVVPQAGSSVSADTLKAELRQRLPSYMIPSLLHFIDAVPLTHNGKVDRSALARSAPVEQIPTLSTLEQEVTDCVEAVIGRPVPDVDTDLLALGANSVHAIRIANAIERRFGARPDIDGFYRTPSVRALAGWVEGNRQHAPRPPEPSSARALDGSRRELRSAEVLELSPDSKWDKQLLVARASHRNFSDAPLAAPALARVLACLAATRLEDREPKYAYASAGGLYPISVFVEIKAGRVENLRAGLYRYDPLRHGLSLAVSEELSGDYHEPFLNRGIYEKAAFSILLVADTSLIDEKYGRRARDYCLLEAGEMAQLLVMSAALHEVGMCQIGQFDAERAGALLSLPPTSEVLHCLVGGSPLLAAGERSAPWVETQNKVMNVLDSIVRGINREAL